MSHDAVAAKRSKFGRQVEPFLLVQTHMGEYR